jgi:hypothetical protein
LFTALDAAFAANMLALAQILAFIPRQQWSFYVFGNSFSSHEALLNERGLRCKRPLQIKDNRQTQIRLFNQFGVVARAFLTTSTG